MGFAEVGIVKRITAVDWVRGRDYSGNCYRKILEEYLNWEGVLIKEPKIEVNYL